MMTQIPGFGVLRPLFSILGACALLCTTSSAAECVNPPTGLVGWWTGDNTTRDASGNWNDAQTSAISFQTGKVGGAFVFNANSTFEVPPASELKVVSLTFAAWIRPSDSSYAPIIMYQHPNDYHGAHFWTGDRFGNPRTLYANLRQAPHQEALIEAANVVVPEQWSFVAVTYNQSSGLTRLYANGEVVKEETLPIRLPNTSGSLFVGNCPPSLDLFGGTRFPGSIDEPMVFNRALSVEELNAIYNAGAAGVCRAPTPPLAFDRADPALLRTNDLLAVYSLNGTAADGSGRGLNGTLHGPTPVEDRFGRTDGALYFNGTNDFIDLGNPAEFNFTNGFTLNAWVKTDGGQNSYVLGKYSYESIFTFTNNSYGLGLDESLSPYGFAIGDAPTWFEARGGNSIGDGQWHAISLVYDDGQGLRLYADGQLRAVRQTGDLAPFTNNLPLFIGKIASGLHFRGSIDDVSIFNRALDDQEVRLVHHFQRFYSTDVPVVLSQATATYSQTEFGNYSAARAVDGIIDSSTAWGIYPNITNQVAAFETTTDVGVENGTVLTFNLVFNHPSVDGTTSHALGKFRLSITTDSRSEFADGLQSNGDVTANWADLQVLSVTAASGATLTVQPDNSILASGTVSRLDTYTIKTATRLTGITGVRLEVLEDTSLPHDGPGREPLNGNFALSELLLAARPGGYPFITNAPSSLTITNGNSVTLEVGATSSLPMSYQWLLNGAAIEGATNASFTLTNVNFSDAGTYTVELENAEGLSTTEGAVLNVVPVDSTAFAILSVSNSTPTNAPISDIFGAPLAGTDFLVRVYAGATAESLVAQGPAVPFLTGEEAGYFHPLNVVLTNVPQGSNAFAQLRVWEAAAGSTFESAVSTGGQHGSSANIETTTGSSGEVTPVDGLSAFSLVAAPRVVKEPSPKTVYVGESASFSVTGWGSDLRYQWYVNSNAVAGATSPTLVLTNLQENQAGPVYVVITNTVGSISSAVAVLTVLVPDTTPPVISISSPVASNTFETVATLSGTVTDDRGVAEVSWSRNGQPGGELVLSEGQFSLAELPLTRGLNTFRVTASDTSGNVSFNEVTITNLASRSLFIADISPLQEGARVEVPVMLFSRGDVGGVTFTMGYNRDFLAEPEIRWEPAVEGALLSFNTNLFNSVRASFALSGSSVPTGEVRIATISFRARSVPNPRTVPLGLSLNGLYSPSGQTLSPVGTEVRSGDVQITVRKYKGDNNANDRLDIVDASTIMRLDSGLEQLRPWDTSKNDLNNNLQIDVGDVIRVLRTVVGLDPQPGGGGGAGGLRALAASSARMALQFDKSTAAPGEQVKVLVSVADYSRPLAAASFRLRYPTNALRLNGATSHNLGAIVPTSAAAVWNVSPAQNDYDAQDGGIFLAVTSDRPWATNGGLVAELTFTVQPGATNQHRWALALQQGELSNGLDLFGASGSEAYFVGRDAVVPEFNRTPEISEAGISLSFAAELGLRYRIEASEDLQNWTAITTVTSDGSTLSYTDPIGEKAQRRFYRAVQIE
ncbi:MAG TPA: LamG-like jellyroll fold domain-containing protein [Verrucomicrobiae bacterium]